MMIKGLTLRRLHIFVRVVEQGSFNLAAQSLHLSQAAVSQQMRQMELALGVVLFRRTPQGVRLTAKGEVMHGYAERLLGLAVEAETAVMQLDQAGEQRLRLGATAGISVYLLPPWLKQFQLQYPTISLAMQTAHTRVVLDSLGARQLDFAFFVGHVAPPDADVERITLQEVAYQVVMNANHPLAGVAEIELSMLSEAAFINRPAQSRHRQWLDGEMARLGVRLNNTAELENPGVIKYALLNEMGVSILPAYAVAREVAQGEIVAKPLASGPLLRPLLLMWVGKRPFTAVQRAFLGALGKLVPVARSLLTTELHQSFLNLSPDQA